MRWVTGQKAGLNALACAWLIRRFIDPHAVILFSSDDKVKDAMMQGFIPFYIPNHSLCPQNECPTFSALIERFHLDSPPLKELESLIRQAEKSWGEISMPIACGLKALGMGLQHSGDNDAEILFLQEYILDALYFGLSMQFCAPKAHGKV